MEAAQSGTAGNGSGAALSELPNNGGHWSSLGRVLTHSGGRFSKHVRITRGGSYRIEAHTSGGDLVSGFSQTVTIHTHS